MREFLVVAASHARKSAHTCAGNCTKTATTTNQQQNAPPTRKCTSINNNTAATNKATQRSITTIGRQSTAQASRAQSEQTDTGLRQTSKDQITHLTVPRPHGKIAAVHIAKPLGSLHGDLWGYGKRGCTSTRASKPGLQGDPVLQKAPDPPNPGYKVCIKIKHPH